MRCVLLLTLTPQRIGKDMLDPKITPEGTVT